MQKNSNKIAWCCSYSSCFTLLTIFFNKCNIFKNIILVTTALTILCRPPVISLDIAGGLHINLKVNLLEWSSQCQHLVLFTYQQKVTTVLVLQTWWRQHYNLGTVVLQSTNVRGLNKSTAHLSDFINLMFMILGHRHFE